MYIVNNGEDGVRIIFPSGDTVFIDPCLLSDIFARTTRYFILLTASRQIYKLDMNLGVNFTQGVLTGEYYNARDLYDDWVRVECSGGNIIVMPGGEREFIMYFTNKTELLVPHMMGLLAVDVQIKDTEGDEIMAEVTYLNPNELMIYFNPAASGMVRCSP